VGREHEQLGHPATLAGGACQAVPGEAGASGKWCS